jgi:hypothetical protein
VGVHRRAETVVVVAVAARTVIVAEARRHRDDHPALGARPIPVEAYGVEVLEGGEAVEFIAQFVVRHDGEGAPSVNTTERDFQGDSLDMPRTHFHVFFVVDVTVVRIEEDRDITPIGVVSDVLQVIVDCD